MPRPAVNGSLVPALALVVAACTAGEPKTSASTPKAQAQAPEPKPEPKPKPEPEPKPEPKPESSDFTSLIQAGPDRPGWPFRAAPVTVSKTVQLCERDWVLAKRPSAELTARCIDVYLDHAYGGVPSESELDFDPYYGTPLELRYTATQLLHMAKLAEAGCPGSGSGVSRCERAAEFLHGSAMRKTSLFEDVNVDDIGPALTAILAGRRVAEDELWLTHWGLSFSLLNLWKLEAAVYARHGQAFIDEDLTAFFYGPRNEEWRDAGLPTLTAQAAGAEYELSEADRFNLQRIAAARARLLGQRQGQSRCYLGERLLFDCELEDGWRASLCAGPKTETGAMSWGMLRLAGERDGKAEAEVIPELPWEIDELLKVEAGEGKLSVEIRSDWGRRIERLPATTPEGPARYRVSLIDGSEPARSCTGVVVDELDELLGDLRG